MTALQKLYLTLIIFSANSIFSMMTLADQLKNIKREDLKDLKTAISNLMLIRKLEPRYWLESCSNKFDEASHKINWAKEILDKYSIKFDYENYDEFTNILFKNLFREIYLAEIEDEKYLKDKMRLCDISGLDKKALIKALYDAATLDPRSKSEDLSEEEINKEIEDKLKHYSPHISWLNGKRIEVYFENNKFDSYQYNMFNGYRVAQYVIARLREKQINPSNHIN